VLDESVAHLSSDRPGVSHLADAAPLAMVPILGKTWLNIARFLAGLGAKEILIVSSDRPQQVRSLVDGGTAGD